MANEEQLSILKQGADVWNKWMEKNSYTDIDLSRANLTDISIINVPRKQPFSSVFWFQDWNIIF